MPAASRQPVPDWARLLSALLYGSGIVRVVNLINSLSMWSSIRSVGGAQGYTAYLAVFILMMAALALGDIAVARMVTRAPHYALRGVWILLAIAMVGSMTILIAGITSAFALGTGTPSISQLVAPALNLVAFYGPMAIVLGRRRAQMLRRPHDPACCANCGYSLVGLTEPRCPECGTAVADDQIQQDGARDGH